MRVDGWMALLVCVAVPMGAAQMAYPAPLIEDPAGDVRTATIILDGGTTLERPAIDLLSLSILEDPFDLHFRVRVADMLGDQDTRGDIQFTLGATVYTIDFVAPADGRTGFYAQLWTSETTGQGASFVKSLPTTGDRALGTVDITVSRGDLSPEPGRTLQAGDTLFDARATSYDLDLLTNYWDAAPDNQTGPSFTLEQVVRRSAGPFSLTTDRPFVTSNGEATTYRYDMRIASGAASQQELRLIGVGVPPGWNLSLPGELLAMPPERTVDFPVFLTTPFNHVHGATESFLLRLESAADATQWAEAELGVHYLGVAHPAGHHDTLRLRTHSWDGGTGWITMDTLPADQDAGAPRIFMAGGSMTSTQAFFLSACLQPALSMGLDFDLSRAGTVQVPIEVDDGLEDAVLSGALRLVDRETLDAQCRGPDTNNGRRPDTEAPAGLLGRFRSDPTSITGGVPFLFEAPLAVTQAADLVPFDGTKQLVLDLVLDGEGLTAGLSGAAIGAGGSLTLPLFDYHQPVPATDFTARTAQEGAVADSGSEVAFRDLDTNKESSGLGGVALLVALAAIGARSRR